MAYLNFKKFECTRGYDELCNSQASFTCGLPAVVKTESKVQFLVEFIKHSINEKSEQSSHGKRSR